MQLLHSPRGVIHISTREVPKPPGSPVDVPLGTSEWRTPFRTLPSSFSATRCPPPRPSSATTGAPRPALPSPTGGIRRGGRPSMLAATDSAHGSRVLGNICWVAIFEAVAGDARVPVRVARERRLNALKTVFRARPTKCILRTRDQRRANTSCLYISGLNPQDRNSKYSFKSHHVIILNHKRPTLPPATKLYTLRFYLTFTALSIRLLSGLLCGAPSHLPSTKNTVSANRGHRRAFPQGMPKGQEKARNLPVAIYRPP